MISEGDIQWWVLEARKNPASAPAIIEELARRLVELDSENERLRDEAVRSQARAPKEADGAELVALREKVAALQRLVDETRAELSLVLVSARSQPARLEVRQAQRLARERCRIASAESLINLRRLLPVRTSDDLLLLSSLGRGSVVHASDIPPAREQTIWPELADSDSKDNEWLATAATSTHPPRFRTVVTRRGFVRQYIRVSFDRALELGQHVVESPLRRDEARAIVDGDAVDLMVVTRWGKAERFPQRSVAAQGSVGIELEEDDEVVAALPLDDDSDILVATAAGYVARRASSALAAATLPGGRGKGLIRAYDVLAVFPFDAGQHLLYITYSGKVVIEPLRDVPLAARSTKGHLLHELSHDPAIAVALLPSTFVQDVTTQ